MWRQWHLTLQFGVSAKAAPYMCIKRPKNAGNWNPYTRKFNKINQPYSRHKCSNCSELTREYANVILQKPYAGFASVCTCKSMTIEIV